MGQGEKRGSDTLDAIASARTLPSGDIDPLSSADTVLASQALSTSTPRLPTEGGEVLGNRYEILGELGRGGEGVVYRARDLKADAIVALKLLQHDEGSSSRLQRFRRELQMARKVTHPNVVRIHDLIELPGRFGLSMELIEGQPLDARLEGAPLTKDEIVRLALDLARALAAAHEAGVTHRDLKPANVLLRAGDGHAVVTDFGVSRAHGTDTPVMPSKDLTPLNLTREGTIIGTPQYMAPEQLDGRIDIGPAADVYAFGLVIYEAATRERPHASTTFAELRRRRKEEKAPSLREKRPDLPRALCDVVDRALEREAGDRFSGGGDLLAALEPLVSTGKGRSGWVLLALAGAVAGAAGVALYAISHRAPAMPPPPAAAGPSGPATPPLDLKVSNVRPLTSGEGCEEFPHFTPDGRSLVYDGTVGRDSFIYEIDVAPGSVPRQVTQVQGWDIAPSVSPDGKRVAFVRFEGERVAAHVAPLDGSAPPHLVVRGSVRPSWTRDGRAIWAGSGAPLGAYDVASGALLRAPKGMPVVRTAQTVELADGSLVVVAVLDEARGRSGGGLAVFPPERDPRWLFHGDVDEVLAVTADGRHALFARERAATSVELVDQPLDGSPATSLAAAGISPHKGVAFSPDDRLIAWSACVDVPQIVGFDRAGKLRRVVESDMPEPSYLTSVPGTSQVAVVSTRAGKPQPWLVGLSSDALPQPIAVGALAVRDVAIAHDGVRFVVTVSNDGLYVGSLRDAAALRKLTADGSDASPAFRMGDAQIVFTRHPPGAPSVVMSVPIGGGDATAVLGDDSDSAEPSPVDDQLVYLQGASAAEVMPEVWDGHRSRLLSKQLQPGRYGRPHLSPDGRRAALVRGDTEILEVNVATGAIVRTLATPTGDQLADPTYTPSGLVAIRVRFQGNLWMADVTP
jgi:Tol biopolymer transport system component